MAGPTRIFDKNLLGAHHSMIKFAPAARLDFHHLLISYTDLRHMRKEPKLIRTTLLKSFCYVLSLPL